MKPWSPFENRCDRCGAESWFRFEKIVMLNAVETAVHQLFFCGHHGRRWEPELTAQGFTHDNYTHHINSEPSVSASI